MTLKQFNQLRTKFSSYSSGEFLSLFINKLISNMSLSLLDQAKMGNLESEGTYQPLETELYKNCIECISLASSNDLNTLVGLLRRLPSHAESKSASAVRFSKDGGKTWETISMSSWLTDPKYDIPLESHIDPIVVTYPTKDKQSFEEMIAGMSEECDTDINDLGTREYAEARRPLPTPISNINPTLPSSIEDDGDPMLGYEYEESEMYERDRGLEE